MLHIGKRIKEIFDLQPKHHTIEWFAERLSCNRTNIYNIFNRSTIDTELLLKISSILDHDFFADLSRQYEADNATLLDDKEELYNELMQAYGRLLYRQLKRSALSGNTAFRYPVNDYDSEESPFPPSRFRVAICSGESDEVEPHIHVRSVEEDFEVRITVNSCRLLPVRRYGSRKRGDTFRDILSLASEWFTTLSRCDPSSTNARFVALLYKTINHTPLS